MKTLWQEAIGRELADCRAGSWQLSP